MKRGKCKHVHHAAHTRLVTYADGWQAFAGQVCDCGEWLSLGPAADDDERVQVEIRAAELEDDLAVFRTHEFWGFLAHKRDYNVEPEWEAGWLAREIRLHGRDVPTVEVLRYG
jgi:hypothetical protein